MNFRKTWNMWSFHRPSLKHFLNYDILFFQRSLQNKPAIILGIESSCDETACGIVDDTGTILGEAINSQHLIHLNFGGIIPTFAKGLHEKNITKVCETALQSANLRLRDIDAVAVTVKPGLPMSLKVGTRFGKYLASIGNKPFIPIHHMEAHALTARMKEKIDFPFLAVLVSGGHCLLTIVENVDKFYLLGTCIGNSPGELFDKVARRLKLKNIPEFSTLSGGQALEIAASKASDINKFPFSSARAKHHDCNFSFTGLLSTCILFIEEEEKKHNIIADMIIPDVYNLSAAIQLAVIEHICRSTQRAMEFIDKMSLFPKDKKVLVVSGGVACNNLLTKALSILSTELNYNFVRTPSKLCTDNGVMIAWNGMERWITDRGVIRNQDEIKNVEAQWKAPLGENWSWKVKNANLKCKWVQIKKQLF